MRKEYHVFADNLDEWVASKAKALKIYKALCKEFDNVRLYVNKYDKDGNELSEDYVMGKGEFPR